MKMLSSMMSVTSRLTVAAALFLGGLMGSATPAPAEIRIQASPGGDVLAYLEFFAAVEKSRQRVVLDGPCLSACTLVLSAVPHDRICVTPRAVLGFHAAQLLDRASHRRYPASAATRLLAATYPAAVQSWIDQHGGLSSRLLLLRGKELAALYPRCA